MMTPCEKLGWKVGDLFVAMGSKWFPDGTEVTFIADCGDSHPEFVDSEGNEWYEYISKMTPIVLIKENE